MSKRYECDQLVGLRMGDLPVIHAYAPAKEPDCYGVMAATITPLPEPVAPRDPERPAVPCAIVGCFWNETLGGWQWVYFTPAFKELLGDIIFDNDLERDVWHSLTICRKSDRDALDALDELLREDDA